MHMKKEMLNLFLMLKVISNVNQMIFQEIKYGMDTILCRR